MGDTPALHVILVSGESNVGKTTLIERLIPRLRKRGLRVGTVKHAHHGFELDRPGKDSWRHLKAGAAAVALVGPTQAAWLMATSAELSCRAAVERMRDQVDLVLVEGFKQTGGQQILLEPSPNTRICVNHNRCRIGVRPDELSPEEWEALVEFCVPAITVRILCFAQLKDRLGEAEFLLAVPAGAKGRDLLRLLRERCPSAGPLLNVSRLAVHQAFVSEDVELHQEDEVAVIPPVSGG